MHVGMKNKLRPLCVLCSHKGTDLRTCRSIGAGLNGLRCRKDRGLSACPADGTDRKDKTHARKAKGGDGAVRGRCRW